MPAIADRYKIWRMKPIINSSAVLSLEDKELIHWHRTHKRRLLEDDVVLEKIK